MLDASFWRGLQLGFALPRQVMLVLSITIPLVPPFSNTAAAAVVVGIRRVMSKFSTQPALKGQRPTPLLPFVTPTKSLSVVPFLSSVNGEASPVLFEISNAPVITVQAEPGARQFRVLATKPIRYNAGLLLLFANPFVVDSLPTTYRNPEAGPSLMYLSSNVPA